MSTLERLRNKRDYINKQIFKLLNGGCPFVEFHYSCEDELFFIETAVDLEGRARGAKLYYTNKDNMLRVARNAKELK